MAARHGRHREARAWALAKLILAGRLLAFAMARRERAERVYRRAVEDEQRVTLPRPLRRLPWRENERGEDGEAIPVTVEHPAPHGEWSWAALARLAACAEDEARALRRCVRLSRELSVETRTELLDEDRRTEWAWDEQHPTF